MSLSYKPNYCENCKKENAGKPSTFQRVLFGILILLGVVPGIIYYLLASPSLCYSCGLKRRHRKEKRKK